MIKGIKFPITADPRTGAAMSTVKAQLGGIKGALRTVNDMARSAGRSMRNVGLGMSAGITAPLTILGKDAVKLFDIQKQAEDSVRQVLNSTGGASGKSADQLFRIASGLQEISTYGDEDILRNVTAPLLTFTQISGKEFDRAQKAILDVSTLLKMDLKSASLQVGKALNDPVAGLSALSRAGITFSEDQKAVIKSLVETGKVAEAQSLMLDELERQFGGQAEAAALAPLGAMKQLSNAVGDLKEQLGEQIVPFLVPLVQSASKAVKWFSDLSPAIKKSVVVFGAMAAIGGPVLGFLGLATIGIASLTTALGAMAAVIWPITAVVAAIGAIAAIGTYVYRNWDGLGGFFRNLWGDIKAVHVSALQTLKSEAEKYSPETVRAIEQTWTAHAQVLGTIWKGHKDAFSTAWTGIRDLARGDFAPANLFYQWDTIGTRFSMSMDGVKQALIAKWEEIKLAVAQWPEDFIQLGRDLVAGLTRGIEEAWQNVTQGIADKMNSVTSAAKAALGVQSPSRVFKQIGHFLMEGLQLGIEGGAPLAEGAMKGVTEKVIKPLSGTGVSQIAGTVKSAFSGLFQTIVSGSGSAADAVKRLTDALLSMVLEKSIFGALAGLMPSIFGAGGTIPLVANAKGNAFAGGRVVPFATGGIVSAPTVFPMRGATGLMGEAGPEGILPLARVRGRLGVNAAGLGGGGQGGGTVVQVIDQRSGGAPVETRRERGPDGREMVIAVIADAENEGRFDAQRRARTGTTVQKVRRG
ncbi:phage tail length tape measure family protein [Vannielia litorea]|uniref:phage tail length tape measure family protein n=1 Tax=Vannielia litorea TaxID=1217970 RepID=UPI001BCC2A7B|nr:hypothetical protein [Vannielia litorea]